MTEQHHRVDYLRELGEAIKENREMLTTDLVTLEERFQGDAKWQNILSLEDQRTGEIVDFFLIKNDEDSIYPYPADRNSCPWGQGTDWRITSQYREVQPAALDAQEELEEAKTSAHSLDNLTAEDLDALGEIPTVLSEMLGRTRRARDWFSDGELDILDRQQAKVNDTEYWVGPGSNAYVSSLGVQASYFRRCKDDLNVVEQGCLEVSDATIELAIAISNIYVEKIDQWSGIISTALSIAGGPTNWVTYAKELNSSISKHMKKQAEEFQSKIEELGQLEATQSLVQQANNIRMNDWPSPTQDALLQT